MKFVKLVSVIIILFLASCATPHYVHDYRTSRVLDFRTGKYLVNNIETNLPWKAEKHITENLLKKLKKVGGDSIIYIDSVRLKYSLPNHISYEPPSETLDLLKLTTDFNYLINVRTREVRDDMGSILLSAPLNYNKNEAEAEIMIYDIKSGLLIYDQRIIGTIEVGKQNSEVRISKSANSLMVGALNKGLKEIKKHAVK